MSDPEQLIVTLTRRIDAFEQGDPRPVLDQQALAEARAAFRQAMDADGGVSLHVAQVVAWLHWYRYQVLPAGDDQDDLQAALELFTQIAEADPQAVPEAVLRYLSDSASGGTGPARRARTPAEQLQQALQRDDPAALDQAIVSLTAAAAATRTDDPNHVRHLSNLGFALRTRYQRTWAGGDLDEAVAVGREAVAATPAGHPDRDTTLSNLGVALQMRFERTGTSGDLDDAVAMDREAVALTPADHPARATRLSDLGLALRMRFERTGTSGDLDEAVAVGREAVAATLTSPTSPADRAGYQSNLSACW